MSLQEQLLAKVMEIQKNRGLNPQKVLDTSYFNNLSIEDKAKFIADNKEALGQEPTFDWRGLRGRSTGMAGAAGIATLVHQISTKGGPGFKPNMWAIGGAVAAGALVGGFSDLSKTRQDYRRDLTTKRNIDDVIAVMVHRGLNPPITRFDISQVIEKDLAMKPFEYGKKLSDIDFDNIKQNGV